MEVMGRSDGRVLTGAFITCIRWDKLLQAFNKTNNLLTWSPGYHRGLHPYLSPVREHDTKRVSGSAAIHSLSVPLHFRYDQLGRGLVRKRGTAFEPHVGGRRDASGHTGEF